MYGLTTAAALVATAGYVLAAPSALVPRKTFQVSQIAKGKVFINGPTQVVKTHQKYAKLGATVPSDAAAAAAAVQSGSVAANPEQYDESYLCPVSVGGQTLNLDFDTGSADLWVFSTVTPSSESTGHARYNPSTSGTLKSGYKWNISYGDGSGASGTVYADKVVVGGVTATSQAVEAATSVSAQFTQDTNNDGLLGLAFSSINTVTPQQQTTFFDTVKPTLAKPLFAVDLKKGTAGSYQFGYIDSSKYTGSITYTSVSTANGFWQFTAGGYSVGTSTTTSGSISGASIADTGTTLLYLPDAVVTAYYAKVSGAKYDSTQGGYTFPSSSTLPNFNVNIGGTVFTVPGSYIKFAPVSSTTYFGGIQSSAGIGFNIFGDIFLKAVYAIFDESQSTPRLGFAKQS
ncbi:Aspartic protease [Cryoendolithus antarcticus]|uniref:Aspartic protease n=1 Tax=Cryoendolithus antarcticus TaxID=1507870 RepID=A0A1V8T3Q1_9PEZI|nr:Aspartic protease [Cryoendolithus antarcticus]